MSTIEKHIETLLSQPGLEPETVRLLELAKEAQATNKMPAIPELPNRAVSEFLALGIRDIQQLFRLPYAAAVRYHAEIQASVSDLMNYTCQEDEMLIFGRGGKWAVTLFWYDPSSARLVDKWFRFENL